MADYRTQLLVIGGGASGMSAAAAAAEKGISVIVTEANPAVGGNGLFPRGIFAVDSVIQRRKLIFADKDRIFTDCMNYSHWKIDGRIIRRLIEKSGDTISWLMEKGVEFQDVVHHIPNQTPEVFHITKPSENVGKAVIHALKLFCQEKKVTFLTSTRGKQLIKNESGKICGAVCVQKDGKEIVIEADKTIVCTGGFSGNKEMIARYFPNFRPDEVAEGGGMRHPGDGVRMALEAGADLEGNFAMEVSAPRLQGYGPLSLLLGKPYNVWLNKFGRRYASEGIVYNFAQSANACMRQPGGQMWVVFDQAIMEKTLRDGRDIVELIHIPMKAEEKLEETIEQAKKDGILCKADSFDEIGAFIGCTPEKAREELEEYNQFCYQGRDAVFAKDPRYLLPLQQGPFYAVKAGTDMLITHGGVRVNEQFQALDKEFLPVSNLFVAGVDFGGADADIYNVQMSGHGFGFAVNSGRIAGENAAGEILRGRE